MRKKIISIVVLVYMLTTLGNSYSFLDVKKGVSKNKELLKAAFDGDIEAVKQSIVNGAEINIENIKGRTPIMNAVLSGNKDIVNLLIEKGAYIDRKIVLGRIPLKYLVMDKNVGALDILIKNKIIKNKEILYDAVVNDQVKIVENILDSGVRANSTADNGYSFLMEACRNGSFDVARILIEKGAEVNAISGQGKTALHEAVLSGNKELVKFLIYKDADLNETNKEGLTPLEVVEKLGYKGIVKVINNPLQEFGYREKLIKAVIDNQFGRLKYLVGQGGDVNTRNDLEQTLLMIAVNNNNMQIAEYLMKKGANVNLKIFKKDGTIYTALIYAVMNKNFDMVDMLMSYGADPNIFWLKEIPLINSANLKNKIDYKILELLLEYGAYIDVRDGSDFTLLMCAIGGKIKVNAFGEREYKQRNVSNELIKEAITLLLDSGLDINEKTYDGVTALMIAVEQNNKEAVKLLLDYGIDKNMQDIYKNTAATIAKKKGFKEIQDLLESN